MTHIKLFMYKDLTQTAPFEYGGDLSIILMDDTKHDITTPVNKLTGSNATEYIETWITDTLSNTGD